MFVSVKVITNARKDEMIDFDEKILKVKLRELPEKGRANRALISFLSKEFNIKKGDVKILRGEKTREKFLEIKGFEEEDLKKYFFKK